MNKPETKTVAVPVPFLQQLANYLQERPWKESNPFLVGIDQLAREATPAPAPEAPAKSSNGKNRVKELAK